MKTITYISLGILTGTFLTGCATLDPTVLDPTGISGMIRDARENQVARQEEKRTERQQESDADLMQRRQSVSMRFRNNPDTDAWLEQRQNIARAAGDRLFDRDFGRVFDSLVVAVSSLELRVNNMERQSGYIGACGIALPPTEAKALRRQAMNDWCIQNGIDPSVLDRQFNSSQMRNLSEMTDIGNLMARPEKMQKALTFQLVKMGEHQTKVKLRFSDVYYPAEIEAYYKLVWESVDKQIFVDQNLEGKPEKRE